MSKIRVISGAAVNWPEVSKLLKSLGIVALITLPGCAAPGSRADYVFDQSLLQGVQTGLRSGPGAGVAAGVGAIIRGGTNEASRAVNRSVNQSVNRATR